MNEVPEIDYSKDAKQGWLTKKSIDDLRNAFGNDIFRNEQYKLFTMETDLRNRLKEEAKYDLYATAASIGNSYETTTRMTVLFRELVSKLQNYSGRKQYGYLPADIKDTVNKIVSELAKDNGIAELYDEWSKVNREKLSLYYDKKKAPVPLEDNKEFRSIKNMIVKAAVEFTTAEISAAHTAEIDTTVKSFVSALVQMITQSYKKKIFRLNSQIDGKLKSKIEQKKQAHGLKTDRSVQTDHSEDEEQGFTMNM